MENPSEWLETDGLGGFASGTVDGVRTRRYHALLLSALTPPTGRVVLVNGFEGWLTTPAGHFPITSQRYASGLIHPDGRERIARFCPHPWPTWTLSTADGTAVRQELFVTRGRPRVVLRWSLLRGHGVELAVRPLLSGRDYHALHRENPSFSFESNVSPGRVVWSPYPDLPSITALSNADFVPEPTWYRDFHYSTESERGLDHVEDLASPGIFRWSLDEGPGVWILGIDPPDPADPREHVHELADAERRRRAAFPSGFESAARDYVVEAPTRRTIVAGFPWFTDWGRDTFIAIRGLCLATGQLDLAREILLDWSETVSEGMLPNRFPDRGDEPEYNSVDASLWFVIVAHEWLDRSTRSLRPPETEDRDRLHRAIRSILEGYARGTRYGIRLDEDGLIAAGEPGSQLTWMDARANGRAVTPRVGKPVEIQALWLNALRLTARSEPRWGKAFDQGARSFREKFWDESLGHLRDVIDVDHVAGVVDTSMRPNQILAAGGLPWNPLGERQSAQVVRRVEERLWTPMGLRSLAAEEPGYRGRYEGGPAERDAAYHQGTVWAWLAGPFVEAWLKVNGDTPAARDAARERFLKPFEEHARSAGLGHVSEIADGDPPHRPRGCPFQAWSLGELIRIRQMVLR